VPPGLIQINPVKTTTSMIGHPHAARHDLTRHYLELLFMKQLVTIIASLSLGATCLMPQHALAQPQQRGGYNSSGPSNPYDAAFKAGYRSGYQAGTQRRPYNDQTSQASYYGPGDPNQQWRKRYGQTYSYNDDSYYQECRNSPDPAGVIAGALIGGLLGNAIGRGGGKSGATVAGVIVGGALGANLVKHLDCQDRSYAYKTYSNGFNSGRANSNWQWENPENGHYGDFRVGDYYNDQGGFRCATYTQQVYIDGAPQAASGRACRQPDGVWAIVQ
jgi:surface antigen